jgi:hypothetical protein
MILLNAIRVCSNCYSLLKKFQHCSTSPARKDFTNASYSLASFGSGVVEKNKRLRSEYSKLLKNLKINRLES